MSRTTAHQELQRYVLDKYGDGVTAPCFSCGAPLQPANGPCDPHTPGVLTLDRILPGRHPQRGKYVPQNVRPACASCNEARDYREYALWLWRAA